MKLRQRGPPPIGVSDQEDCDNGPPITRRVRLVTDVNGLYLSCTDVNTGKPVMLKELRLIDTMSAIGVATLWSTGPDGLVAMDGSGNALTHEEHWLVVMDGGPRA